jgi:hypothetical protein
MKRSFMVEGYSCAGADDPSTIRVLRMVPLPKQGLGRIGG